MIMHVQIDGFRNFLVNVKWDNIFQYCFTVDACCEAVLAGSANLPEGYLFYRCFFHIFLFIFF